ncbi:protein kinase domain-containing protein [Micromonospora sp. WMMD729]|uniref:protein kinase domain-containing protein n=1 Tax=Micromonospora sp. WMMD729 TaxID=3404127 RepID=UPI003BF510C5
MRLLQQRYRLDDPVGHGGMAVVWRGFDLRLQRMVAVKMLSPELLDDPSARERLRAEALAAAMLDHPHIAAVYDYGEQRHRRRRTPFLVMEFVDGETLAARLERSGAMAWPEAARIGAAVADALARGVLDPRRVAVPLADALPGVRVVVGEVDGIDVDGRTVSYTDVEGRGGRLAYHRLVLAAGSVNKLLPIPGVADHAHGFRGIPEAVHLRERLVQQIGVRVRLVPRCRADRSFIR